MQSKIYFPIHFKLSAKFKTKNFPLPVLNTSQKDETLITANEIERAIRSLPPGTTPGGHRAASEPYKRFLEASPPSLLQIHNKMAENQSTLTMYTSTICLIDRHKLMSNYRPLPKKKWKRIYFFTLIYQ